MARSPDIDSQARVVRDLLKEYAERGVLRGVSEGERRGGRTTFTILWHYGRQFRLVLDPRAGTVSFPALLPAVSGRAAMVRELKAFLRRFETDEVPDHRRIDPTKASLRVAVRAGNVSVGLAMRPGRVRQGSRAGRRGHAAPGDVEYCTRRLVHLVQEVFLVFLPDGPYDDYRVEQLGLDPNLAWT